MTKHVVVLPVGGTHPEAPRAERQRIHIQPRDDGRGMAVSMTVALRYFAGRASSPAAALPALGLTSAE